MTTTEIFPSQDDLLKLVNNNNFSTEDISFQKAIVSRHMNIAWDTYINNLHNIFTNYIDPRAFSEEIIQIQSNPNSNKLFVPTLASKHTNVELQKQIQVLNQNFNKLLEPHRKRFFEFENKLSIHFFILLLEGNCDEKIALDVVNAFLKDSIEQYRIVNPFVSEYLKNVNNLVESLYLPNLSKITNQLVTSNFYFPNISHLLSKLHDLLVENKIMNENLDFVKLFETEYPNQKLNLIKFHSGYTHTQAFYLLFRLNNKRIHMGNDSIAKVAYRLFRFENNPTENSLSINFQRALPRFNDDDYVQKKMTPILTILNKLGIE